MKRIIFLCLAAVSLPVWGGQARMEDIHIATASGHTRVTMEITDAVTHSTFTLSHPARVVVDLENTAAVRSLRTSGLGRGLVKRVRSGVRYGTDLRLVLDLKHATTLHSYLAPASRRGDYRLVIDLGRTADTRHTPAVREAPPSTAATLHSAARPIVVAVDAGHGGIDDGAHGPNGVLEKNVTLSIARKLAARINATPGMKAFMTRKGDHYVGLKQRIVLAHKAHADLFVSIHANAVRHARYVHGAAVYVLSKHGATSTQARLLAERENSSERIGGTRLDNKDRMLASVLLDLSQTAAIEASMNLADRLLNHLDDMGALYKSRVQRANFVVLRAPDIPSVLVETAFITNPRQERELESTGYQNHMAAELMAGIRGYFNQYRPARRTAVYAAKRGYRVQAGDTLSEIAAEHEVSLARLRAANAINDDTIQVGDTLRIPTGGG